MTATPRDLVEAFEKQPVLPAGADERFSGYGLMGMPLVSGHVLAMRRFPLTSVGPGYTSLWLRAPGGRWSFFADAPPHQACTRYFGAAAAVAKQTEVRIAWTEPYRFRVSVPAIAFEWDVSLGSTGATQVLNAMGGLLPESAWRSTAVLGAMGVMAGPMLGVGRIGLRGRVPNGQTFVANPRTMWAVTTSRVRMNGKDLGPPGPVHPQARLGDFWIPQRGIFAIGQAYFEPFDAARHSALSSIPPENGGEA
jgi:hypothetical protein